MSERTPSLFSGADAGASAGVDVSALRRVLERVRAEQVLAAGAGDVAAANGGGRANSEYGALRWERRALELGRIAVELAGLGATADGGATATRGA